MMRNNRSAALAALSILSIAVAFGQDTAHANRAIREAQMTQGAPGMIAANITVGQNLEETAMITLTGPSPDGDLRITITSNDPAKLLLATTPDGPGSRTIALTVGAGFRHVSEFYVRGLAGSGSATYTATAPGYPNATGTVTLGPSGIVLGGPGKLGAPASKRRPAHSLRSRFTRRCSTGITTSSPCRRSPANRPLE